MPDTIRPIKPEILSPAGYWPQLQAAIEAGADAVYFGLKHFTARAKVGFSLEELPRVMRTLHRRGVKGYVTFNTLVFDHELLEACRTLANIAEAGADAIIVQDVGIAHLARQIAPSLAIHGSTQMSITSAEGVRLAQQLGVSRVVLARELSLDDIRTIRDQTDCELEIFVHGALCVSYSGQCFSSEAWGGRSANRGQCAQACRLPYEMLVDDQLHPTGDARYLLSPGDLYALDHIPEIARIGISTLKIEGRYKDANYVALTTSAYRAAVDAAWAGVAPEISQRDRVYLEQAYSRGLGPYFIAGTNHQEVVKGRAPRHRGVLGGRVARVQTDFVVVMPEPAAAAAPLKAGDGIVFDAAGWRSPEAAEEGGRVFEVVPLRAGQLELHFGRGAIDTTRIRPGDLVWRTHDPDLDKIARRWTAAGTPVHKQPVAVNITAREGIPLRIEWRLVDDPTLSITVQSPEPLALARHQALTAEFAREQLGRLGNTPYELVDLRIEVDGHPFVPSSLMNQLRREAVEQLGDRQGRLQPVEIRDPVGTATAAMALIQPHLDTPTMEPQLHLLVRTPEQLAAALEQRPASITLDYLELYGLRPAVQQVQARGIAARVASPRILKPSEQRVIHFLLKLGCPILVRSGGLLAALQEVDHEPLIGDFSLNVANVVSAERMLRLGLQRITPTHDLNAAQIAGLAGTIGPDQLEVIAYQHLPVFHTEHCVFCRFLSTGTSFKDCGHPCERHRVALQDVNGRAHPVMADVGCRNTVFGAEAQQASRHINSWLEAGIRHYRLEFVHESPDQVAAITGAFRNALDGRLSTRELAHRLHNIAPQGTTEGSLFVPNPSLSLPLVER
jgi:U32 family peptidase